MNTLNKIFLCLAAAILPAVAMAGEPDSGHTAWMLTATALGFVPK